MEQADIDAIVEAVRDSDPSDAGWWRMNCIFCAFAEGGKRDRKRSLGVSSETGRVACFKCGYQSYLPPDVVEELAAADDIIARLTGLGGGALSLDEEPASGKAMRRTHDDFGRLLLDPPDSFVPLYENPALTARAYAKAREYMIDKRRVTDPAVWARHGLGACLDGREYGRVVVPILNYQGEWVGYSARDFTGRAQLKYRYPSEMTRARVIYFEHNLLIETDVPCLIVEGVFDCWPYPDDSAALLGSMTTWQRDFLLRYAKRPLCFVYDGDAWEKAEADCMEFRLEGKAAGHVRLDAGVDPDEVDHAEMMEAARDSINE